MAGLRVLQGSSGITAEVKQVVWVAGDHITTCASPITLCLECTFSKMSASPGILFHSLIFLIYSIS